MSDKSLDFQDAIRALAARLPKTLDHVQTEEATKNAYVMPFLSALGYNVFDPREVVPEYTADVGTKRGEKVDYAIMRDGQPIMLFECKAADVDLRSTHSSQLYRYFSVTDARVAVLTNGILYQFYSDLEEQNKMDSRPFFEFNLAEEIKEPAVAALKRFTKPAFDIDELLSVASDLKYTREIQRLMTLELSSPSDEFVRFFASRVYSGKLTQSVRQQFADITKRALQQFISNQIRTRLKTALASEDAESPAEEKPAEELEDDDAIVTTDDEIEGYHIVKSILRETVDPHRVTIRDVKSYCSVLLDDTNRKPICRFKFDREPRQLILLDAEKNEEKVAIDHLDDIYKHADRLKAMVAFYDGTAQEGAARAEPAGT